MLLKSRLLSHLERTRVVSIPTRPVINDCNRILALILIIIVNRHSILTWFRYQIISRYYKNLI